MREKGRISTTMTSVGRSDKVCPKREKLVDEILRATAELDASRPEVDIDGVVWKKPKKTKK